MSMQVVANPWPAPTPDEWALMRRDLEQANSAA